MKNTSEIISPPNWQLIVDSRKSVPQEMYTLFSFIGYKLETSYSFMYTDGNRIFNRIIFDTPAFMDAGRWRVVTEVHEECLRSFDMAEAIKVLQSKYAVISAYVNNNIDRPFIAVTFIVSEKTEADAGGTEQKNTEKKSSGLRSVFKKWFSK